MICYALCMNLKNRMDIIFDKIFDQLKKAKNNIDYVEIVKGFINDKLLIEKYYANDKYAWFSLEGDKYNYRVYIDFVDNGKYLLEIRKCLSDIYKTYGIHWEISYEIDDYRIFTIEEREKLTICNEDIFTCDNLLLNWKETLDVLSIKLGFKDILNQIKNSITTYKRIDIRNLVLIREGLINANEYAITPNGKIILLEDLDFVFCLTDYKGKVITLKGFLVDVDTTCGEMTFSSSETIFNRKITHIYGSQKKFFLYDYSYKNKYIKDNVKNFDEVLQTQINIYLDKECAEPKYQRECIFEYYDKLKMDSKYIIRKSGIGELTYDRSNEKRLS